MREATTRVDDWLGVPAAADAALREAGGGRIAGVRVVEGFGRPVYAVQFVRGDWLCTASVDAYTGEVTSVVSDGDGAWGEPAGGLPRAGDGLLTLELPGRCVWDVRAGADPGLAYVATDAGVSVVRAGRGALSLVAEYATGLGATRQVTAVPGGVAGITGDGRAFRLGGDGWVTRLPTVPYTIAAAGGRLLIATNAGAVELDAADGRTLARFDAMPVRSAGYLPSGHRVLASHHGRIVVVAGDGDPAWHVDQGEYPERLWTEDDRIYVAGEGGLKEIVPGEGVVCRWATPGRDPVESAVLAAGQVFTCTPGAHVAVHGYATGGYTGRLAGLPAYPEVTAAVRGADGGSLLLTGHRGGLLSAHPL